MSFSDRRSRTLIILAAAFIAAMICFLSAPDSHASSSRYMLKVNSRRNVITAYQKTGGKWKPIRAMLCSCGTGGYGPDGLNYSTISGTYRTGSKARWLHMRLNGVDDYAQYTSHVYGGVYIHAVWYYHPYHSAQATAEYNKLGSNASHGCIRVSTMDAKWIYDHCPSGTIVKVYRSSKSGPLGKPKPVRNPSGSLMSWDPTDPAKGNPNFRMRRTVIKVSSRKKKTYQYGSKFSAFSGVRARDTNANMNVSSWLSAKYYKYSKGKYRRISHFSTKSLGTYKVVYRTSKYHYAPSGSKTFKFKVADYSTPVIKGAKDVTGETGTYDLSAGITASQKSASLTGRVIVTVKKDGRYLVKNVSLRSVKSFDFTEPGTYTVYYKAVNKYNKKKYRIVHVTYTITAPAEPETPETPAGSSGTAAASVTA
ncbi:MAG: L,D-transpeptidase [Anaerovoracaceae bacterium]